MNTKLFRINNADNVAVSTIPLFKGDVVNIEDEVLTLLGDVPLGHKVALKDIPSGSEIVKYGYAIGEAVKDIQKGEPVHFSNVRSIPLDGKKKGYDEESASRFRSAYSKRAEKWVGHIPSIWVYERESGEIGIRNHLLLISLDKEGCRLSKAIEKWAKENIELEDGISTLNPCQDEIYLDIKKLKDLLAHPNIGGALLLGRDAQLELQSLDSPRVRVLTELDSRDAETKARELVKELISMMKRDKRSSQKMDRLAIAIESTEAGFLEDAIVNPLLGNLCNELSAMGTTLVIPASSGMAEAWDKVMVRAESKNAYDNLEALSASIRRPRLELSLEDKTKGFSTVEERALSHIQISGTTPIGDTLPSDSNASEKGLRLLFSNPLEKPDALISSKVHLTLSSDEPIEPFIPRLCAKGFVDEVLQVGKERVSDDLISLIAELANGEIRT